MAAWRASRSLGCFFVAGKIPRHEHDQVTGLPAAPRAAAILLPGIIRRAGASLLDRTIETTPTRRGRSFVRLTPETIIMVYPSERTYLRQLRILGAWWCLGSSPFVPRLLLLYPPAPLGIFGRLSSGQASTRLVGSHSCGTGADGKKPERGSQPQPEQD